jgi:hypothetical protein
MFEQYGARLPVPRKRSQRVADIFAAEDAEIFDALRRVHLIREGERPEDQETGANRSVFWNLDADVAEGVSLLGPARRPAC